MKMDRKAKAGSGSGKLTTGKAPGRASRKAARSNGKHLPATYEHAPIGIVEASLDGHYIHANEEFCRILGYEKQDLLQHGIKDFTHEDDYAIDIRLHERLVAGQIPFYRLEKRFIRKDGSSIWVELTRSIVRDEHGLPLHTVGVVLDISDRKHVERVLRESVERLRLATESAAMFMWEWDFQRQIYTLADNFEQVIGFSAGLLPQNKIDRLFQLSPREDVQAISEAAQSAIENHTDLHSLQYRVIDPETGQPVWLEVSGKVVYNEAGVAERMFGVAQNITEGRRAQDEIASISRFPAENPNPVMRLSLDSQVLYCNEASAPLLESWTQQANLHLPEELQRAIAQAFRSGLKTEVEIEHRGRTFACTLAPIREAGYINLYGKDVTERRQAEDRLRESEERFRALVSQATAGITETDMNSALTFVNPRFCQMLGYSEPELLGKTIWDLTYPEDIEENKRLFERMLTHSESYQFEKRFVRRDGSILWTSVSVSTIRDLAGRPKGGVGVILDINERKQAEETLKEFAREQQALYQFVDQLRRTVSFTDIFNAALQAIISALQCDRASILLFDDASVMRFVAWHGLSEGYRKATDGHSPWTPDASNPQPIAVSDVDLADLDESLKAVIRQEGIGSLAFIPLVSNDRLIGKFMVYFDEPHVYSESELDLSLTIARQLAFGVARKRAEDKLHIRAQQQQAVARFGELAVRERNLQELFDRATVTVSEALQTEYCKVLELQPGGEALLLRSGVGWKEGLVGSAIVGTGLDSQAGYTLLSDTPVVVDDLREEERFHGPALLVDHNVVSGMSCIIRRADGRPWGILGAHTSRRMHFTADDANFLAVMATILSDAIQRQQAEQALRLSEALYRAIARSIPDGGVYVVDKDFRYLVAEGPVTEAFGLSREGLEGRTVWEAFPDERGERMEARLRRTFAGETLSFETRHNGHVYWTRQAPLLDSIGQAIILTIDITERKQAEEALRESEERFSAILRQATAGIVRKDVEGRLIYVNQAFCTMLGYTEAELLGKEIWQFMYREDVAENKRSYDRMLQDGVPFRLERRLIRADGSVIWVDASVSPTMDAAGRPQSVVAVEVDVTGRRQAEEALRRNETMFSTLVDSAPFGVYFIDSDFCLRAINKGSEAVFSGIQPLIGRDFAEILRIIWPEPFASEAIERFRHTLDTGESFLSPPVVETRANTDEIEAYDWQIHRITLSDGRYGVVCYFYDLTKQMRMEAAVRASEERYRNLFDLVPVAVYTCDASGLIEEYNQRALDLWGREPARNDPNEKYCGSYRIYYPDGRLMPHAACPMARTLKGETLGADEREIVVERENGERRTVVAHPLAFRNEMGEIVGAVNCLYDITDRKQAEEALQQLNLQLEERVLTRTAKLRAVNQTLRDEIVERKRVEAALRRSEAIAHENEEKLRSLFELLPVGISFLNPQGQIIQMNPALLNILKLSREEFLNQQYRSRTYIQADGTPMPPTEFASARAIAENRTVYNVETGIVLEDGGVVWSSVSAAPVNVADVSVVVVTVDITDSKRAEQALQESHARLRILSQRLVEVQEDERRALARELHDRVGQTLAALNINLIIINSQLTGEAAELIGTRMNDSMKLVAETIALVRDVMTDLRPAVLDDYGLEAALESHLSQFISRYDINARFEKPGQPIPRLGPSIEMTFLRIAQEALMNIARHARATQVHIALRYEHGEVQMTIRDNGTGIQSWQQANRQGSHGLMIMRERAEAFGGSLRVQSNPGQGTQIEASIPLRTQGEAMQGREP